MPDAATKTLPLDDWARREAIAFDMDSAESFNGAVDRMVAAQGESVDLLGLGEPTHGREEFLVLRNRLFQRLAEAHGFTAIAIESSFPRARVVNDYASGASVPASYDDIADAGFSHGFGRYATTRELVEWMREYNTERPDGEKLRFYGFDSPVEMMWSDSPRRLIEFVLDYLDATIGSNQGRRERIAALVGDDSEWETQEAAFDPIRSIGLSPAAGALRLEVEELALELSVRRPALVAASGEAAHREALQYAVVGRQLLNYHASIARPSENRVAELLGIRDATMADNLVYTVERERRRGRVFVFAHNSHLQRGLAAWQWGPNSLKWWPAGAHVSSLLDSRYAVIGMGVGTSGALGLAAPEHGTLEATLTAAPGPGRFIPTHQGLTFDATTVATRASNNPAYFPLTAQSLTDFDWLAVFDSIS
jgi:erythromycin esterase